METVDPNTVAPAQATKLENQAPISQKQSPSNLSSGYAPSKSNPVVKGNAPITQEGGYYQSRATDLGLMDQSPVTKSLPTMSASLGSGSSPSYGTGGIMKAATAFSQPNASSYQSGTSLTNSIPNIMADSGVQSALGSVTQPVTTGLMRGVPKKPTFQAPAAQMVDLWDDSSVLNNV